MENLINLLEKNRIIISFSKATSREEKKTTVNGWSFFMSWTLQKNLS